jgi:hypothetical protein
VRGVVLRGKFICASWMEKLTPRKMSWSILFCLYLKLLRFAFKSIASPGP